MYKLTRENNSDDYLSDGLWIISPAFLLLILISPNSLSGHVSLLSEGVVTGRRMYMYMPGPLRCWLLGSHSEELCKEDVILAYV